MNFVRNAITQRPHTQWPLDEPPFFFNIASFARSEVEKKAAADGIEEKNVSPFLPFGRVDRRDDEIVIVLRWIPASLLVA